MNGYKLQEINFKQLEQDLLKQSYIVNGVSVISNQENIIEDIYVETDDFYYNRDAMGVCTINNKDYSFKVNKTSLTYRKNSLKQDRI